MVIKRVVTKTRRWASPFHSTGQGSTVVQEGKGRMARGELCFTEWCAKLLRERVWLCLVCDRLPQNARSLPACLLACITGGNGTKDPNNL